MTQTPKTSLLYLNAVSSKSLGPILSKSVSLVLVFTAFPVNVLLERLYTVYFTLVIFTLSSVVTVLGLKLNVTRQLELISSFLYRLVTLHKTNDRNTVTRSAVLLLKMKNSITVLPP